MVLKQLDIDMHKKLNFNPYLAKYIKIKSKWIIYLNTKYKIMNFQKKIFLMFDQANTF